MHSVSAGTPDEDLTQSVTVHAALLDPALLPLFTVQPTIDTVTGTLSFRSSPDAPLVNVTLAVWAVDNGGTAFGGRDTSARVTVSVIILPLAGTPTVSLAMLIGIAAGLGLLLCFLLLLLLIVCTRRRRLQEPQQRLLADKGTEMELQPLEPRGPFYFNDSEAETETESESRAFLPSFMLRALQSKSSTDSSSYTGVLPGLPHRSRQGRAVANGW